MIMNMQVLCVARIEFFSIWGADEAHALCDRLDLPNYPAGVSDGETVGRDGFGHHAAGPDDCIVANFNVCQDNRTSAYPDIVTDADGSRL